MRQHQTFTRLVQHDRDIVGMIAYTLYKKEKLNWIKAYETEYHEEPSIDIVQRHFNLNSDTDEKINAYRIRAEDILMNTINEVTHQEIHEYKESILKDEMISTVNATIKSTKPTFWESVGANVMAGLISAAIITFFSIMLWLWQVKNNPQYLEFLKQQAISQQH